ncbi:MAG: 4-alpha-glucanotransferase [Gemmatimonadales bacterium]
MTTDAPSRAVRRALDRLGIRTLALAIHDASFPMATEEDLGRGTPYGDEAARFLATVRGLGFDAIQLGPQGETSAGNASPYDATLFSQSLVSIAWAPLTRGEPSAGLLDAEELAALVAARPPGCETRAAHRHVHAVARDVLARVHERFRAPREGERTGRDLAQRLEDFTRRNAEWLVPYALYEALCAEHEADHREGWPRDPVDALDRRLLAPRPGEEERAAQRREALLARHRSRVDRYAFGQFLAAEQHAALRERTATLGLRLLGDLQVGASDRDRWSWPAAFLDGYLLGAPPSRTNPEGQPWGYPVLDPDGYAADGASRRLLERRLARVFTKFDGLRVDHPHGLVDPWVYRSDDPDPLRAVQSGARLFGAPDLPDHPALARFAIAGPDDLSRDASTRRWDDDWVARLSPTQVTRYAVLFDVLMTAAHQAGRRREDVACEVLSTMPFPLAQVLARHALGRFRVTQKLDLDDGADVYRPENAAPEDWIMVGTHDTPTIWRLAETWRRDGRAGAHARRLAERLEPVEGERSALAEALARDPDRLAEAFLAELFTTRARHVMIFFADVFGLRETYNAPGTVSEENWSLRLPSSWRRDYDERRARGSALDVPRALAMALRARTRELGAPEPALIAALEAESHDAPVPTDSRPASTPRA